MSKGFGASTLESAVFYLSDSPAGSFNPAEKVFMELAQRYDYVPVYTGSVIAGFDPCILYESLCPPAPSCLLESLSGKENGRYAMLAYDSLLEVQTSGAKPGDPFLMADLTASIKTPEVSLPYFYGGFVGYWSYELALNYQNIKRKTPVRDDMPEQRFFLPSTVVVYDRETACIYLIKWMKSSLINASTYRLACEELADLLERAGKCLITEKPAPEERATEADLQQAFTVNISPQKFYDQVRYVKEQIRRGEIFQAVLSRRWKRKSPARPWGVYRQMRRMNPSPYMFYLDWEDSVLMGASPEMQLKLKDGRVVTRPIAGTRKLTPDPDRNEILIEELITDPKEQAEHLMLLDLGRNDIGRVSRPGTVKVTEFMQIEPYSHVIHLVSTVEGKVKSELGVMEAFLACFPAGTLSGAPKIRAMEIIEEVEQQPRGPYGGAVGHIGFDDRLDSCITIRSIYYRNGTYYLQAGAGIVADSVAELECKETVNKAKFLMLAILEAEGKK